jgi:transcriptional regulator with XRE-family HTH domain
MPRGQKPPVDQVTYELAGVIRAQLARKQLKRGDLLELLGVHRNTLSELLNGKKHIDVRQLIVIADFLGEAPGALLTEAEHEAEHEAERRADDDRPITDEELAEGRRLLARPEVGVDEAAARGDRDDVSGFAKDA